MVDSKLEIGQLVMSVAGRDAKRYGLICEVLSQSFVRVVDGELHRIEAPKKKNIKHLLACQGTAESLVKKWKDGARVTNAEVKRAIVELGAGLGS